MKTRGVHTGHPGGDRVYRNTTLDPVEVTLILQESILGEETQPVRWLDSDSAITD